MLERERGTGINMVFRDILKSLVQRRILTVGDQKRVFSAWMSFSGKLEHFLADRLPDLVTPRQQQFLLRLVQH